MTDEERSRGFPLEVPEDKELGIYSNTAIVRHSLVEFILDFAQRTPEAGSAKLVARITMSPQHAKSLLLALQKNVEVYEQKFGKIPAFEGGFEGGTMKM